MRIAHIVHRYPPALGGAEAYFARLGRYLAGQGHQVAVWTSDALDLEAFWSPTARRVRQSTQDEGLLQVRRFPIRYFPGRRYCWKLLSLLPVPAWQAFWQPCSPWLPELWSECGRGHGFDVVHAAAFPYTYPILCALRLARRCHAPLLLTPFLHLGDPENPRDPVRRAYLKPCMQYLLRCADVVFAQTRLEEEALLACGVPQGRVVLQGMGVEPAECTGGDREAARRRWRLPPGAVVVGHLANKSVEKGTVDLLFAARRLWSDGLPVHLLLAGPEMPNFRQVWPAFSREPRITKLVTLSAEEKRQFYAAIDLFALPSRSDSFGLVLLEAWANGVPCVAYRAGGLAEVVRHSSDGLLVPCGSIPALAEALGTLASDPQMRQQMGRAGQLRVLSEGQWEPRLRLVFETYRRLVRPQELRLKPATAQCRAATGSGGVASAGGRGGRRA
jgi:glycosyltransferase involved in cell wall biosynthesis